MEQEYQELAVPETAIITTEYGSHALLVGFSRLKPPKILLQLKNGSVTQDLFTVGLQDVTSTKEKIVGRA